jgi:hypothetical protein
MQTNLLIERLQEVKKYLTEDTIEDCEYLIDDLIEEIIRKDEGLDLDWDSE